MKRYIVFLAQLLSLVVLSGCFTTIKDNGTTPTPTPEVTEEPDDENSKEYVNEEYSFKTRYPSDWSVTYDVPGALVTFFSPDDEGFRSNVNILVDGGIGEHFTLDEYADLAIEELSSFIENFEQIDFDEFETDNWKGYYIIYTGTYSEYELAWAQVFFMENDNVYIITFASTIDKYEVYISDAEFIAENLVLE